MTKPDSGERQSDIILARLMNLHPKIIDLSLDRTLDLLERLGRPQDKLPPVVHVAGTNGKGSTIAHLRAICEAAGLRVHVYTSPHLVKFHERIRLAGELISETALMDLLKYCEGVNEGIPITYFEITTCAAFKAFADTPADVLLLETGLGGRLDSTNVVDSPAVTIITPISMDHPQFLGNSIKEISAEKAEIQKDNTPSIIGPQPSDALQVIDQVAEIKGSPLARHGIEWTAGETKAGITFISARKTIDLPKSSLPGPHQTLNAGMAVAAALELRDQGLDIPDQALCDGIANTTWAARMQRLTQGPIVETLGVDWDIWLDGGHNAAAGLAIADMIKTWDGRPLYVVFGMLNTKAAGDFLAPLAPFIKSAISVAIPGEVNSLSAEEACQFASDNDITCKPANSIKEAIENLNAEGPARLLICGSLYLAGVVLSHNN